METPNCYLFQLIYEKSKSVHTAKYNVLTAKTTELSSELNAGLNNM